MIDLFAQLCWAFIVLMFWAGLCVIVVAGSLAVYLEVTGR